MSFDKCARSLGQFCHVGFSFHSHPTLWRCAAKTSCEFSERCINRCCLVRAMKVVEGSSLVGSSQRYFTIIPSTRTHCKQCSFMCETRNQSRLQIVEPCFDICNNKVKLKLCIQLLHNCAFKKSTAERKTNPWLFVFIELTSAGTVSLNKKGGGLFITGQFHFAGLCCPGTLSTGCVQPTFGAPHGSVWCQTKQMNEKRSFCTQ